IDLFLAVRQVRKVCISFVELVSCDFVTEFDITKRQSMTSRVFPENQLVCRNSDRLRRHDLVAQRIVDNTMLVNTSLVGECVSTYDCLVRLNAEADNFRKQLASWIKFSRVDARFEGQTIRSNVQRHHNLFQRSISRSLANSI